jgi:hypothetical protein
MSNMKRFNGVVFALWLVCGTLTAAAADGPSFEQTARYILEIVKAFRATYVMTVVQHTQGGEVRASEDWMEGPHYIPLPAQFLKQAAGLVEGVEIDLIGLTPLNQANSPKTKAETDALLRLMKNREKPIQTFIDGQYFKAISADLSALQSCADCHNHHPKATRRDFKKLDVMGGLVVRLKREARSEGSLVGPEPPSRPARFPEKASSLTMPPSPPSIR